jgi:two-component system, LuxR family, sensor kinase FixL
MMAEKTRAELEMEAAELRKRLRTQERRIARLEGKSATGAKNMPPPQSLPQAPIPQAPIPQAPIPKARIPKAPHASAGPSGSESAEVEVAARVETELRHWMSIFVHEMNQPLSAILTTAQACARLAEGGSTIRPRVKPREIADALGVLARQASYAGNLVRRLRDWAVDAPMQRERVVLDEVVRQAAELLAEPLRAAGIELRIEPLAHPVVVWGDPVPLQQVVVNLVRNAIDAMQETPARDRLLIVRLFEEPDAPASASGPPASAAGAAVQGGVAVIDRGPGLSVAVIDRLFRPLVSTKPHGMGLGLAISRHLVEAHGGRLWGETGPHGCDFRFTIPGELPTP